MHKASPVQGSSKPGSRRAPLGRGSGVMNTSPRLRRGTTHSPWRRGDNTGAGGGCARTQGSWLCNESSPEPRGPPGTPSPDTCFPGPTGPGSRNGTSAGGSPGLCQPPCAQTKPPPPGLWGGGRREREPTKAASGAVPGARATPSPTCPERPHPLLPLGRSAGAPGAVAMAAALGRLQLGNYCEHPSCLLPARESRGAGSGARAAPPCPPGGRTLAWHGATQGMQGRKGARAAGVHAACWETPPTFAPAPPTSGPPLELTNQPGTCFF